MHKQAYRVLAKVKVTPPGEVRIEKYVIPPNYAKKGYCRYAKWIVEDFNKYRNEKRVLIRTIGVKKYIIKNNKRGGFK